jgi:hypothetical protein
MTIHLMKSLQPKMNLTIFHSRDYTNKGIVLFLCNIKKTPQQTGQSTSAQSTRVLFVYIQEKHPSRISPQRVSLIQCRTLNKLIS